MTASKMKYNIRGILVQMRQVYQIYQIARYIREEPPLVLKGVTEEEYRNQFLEGFLKKHTFASVGPVRNAFTKALKAKYIYYDGNEFDGHELKVHVDKGYDILDGWKFFPVGVWNEILNQYKAFTTFFFGLISSGIVFGLAKLLGIL